MESPEENEIVPFNPNAIEKLTEDSRKILAFEEEFVESEALLHDELKDTTEFYKEIKEHLDKVKAPTKRRIDLNAGTVDTEQPKTFSFIHLQTANLIALKNHKLSIMKELNAIIKTKSDLKLKEFAALLREQLQTGKGKEDSVIGLAKHFIAMMAQQGKTGITPGTYFDAEDIQDTETIEKEIERRMKELDGTNENGEIGAKGDSYRTLETPVDLEEDEEVGVAEFTYNYLDKMKKNFLVLDISESKLYIMAKDETILELEDAGYQFEDFEVIIKNKRYWENNIVNGYIQEVSFEVSEEE